VKKIVLILVAAVVAMVVWHIYAAGQVASGLEDALADEIDQGLLIVELNPVTNLAVFTIPARASGVTARPRNDAANFEKKLSSLSRERFDIYAMLVPYRVRVDAAKDPTFIATAEMSGDGELRAGPGDTAELVASLKAGDPLMVLGATSGVDGKWTHVRTGNNSVGWVRDELVARR
jgi:hypothetical protein